MPAGGKEPETTAASPAGAADDFQTAPRPEEEKVENTETKSKSGQGAAVNNGWCGLLLDVWEVDEDPAKLPDGNMILEDSREKHIPYFTTCVMYVAHYEELTKSSPETFPLLIAQTHCSFWCVRVNIMPCCREFIPRALYGVLATVLTMYVAVMTQVTQSGLGKKGSGLITSLAFMWVSLYPLLIVLILIHVACETVAKEYLFYAYFRNNILLVLSDVNTNVISKDFWINPSYGWFPHYAIVSTALLAACTGGYLTTCIVVVPLTWSLINSFCGIIDIKSRLVPVNQLSQRTITRFTKDTLKALHDVCTRIDELSAAEEALHAAAAGDTADEERAAGAAGKRAIHPEPVVSEAMRALRTELTAVWEAHEAAEKEGMDAAADILDHFQLVTEVALRQDMKALRLERAAVDKALRQKKISQESAAEKLKTLAVSFGERDPSSADKTKRLPTLGKLRRPPPPSALIEEERRNTQVGNAIYLGLPTRIWALGVLQWRATVYIEGKPMTHKLFARRLHMLMLIALFSVLAIEFYGFYAAERAKTCSKDLQKQCANPTCLQAVCTAANLSWKRFVPPPPPKPGGGNTSSAPRPPRPPPPPIAGAQNGTTG